MGHTNDGRERIGIGIEVVHPLVFVPAAAYWSVCPEAKGRDCHVQVVY